MDLTYGGAHKHRSVNYIYIYVLGEPRDRRWKGSLTTTADARRAWLRRIWRILIRQRTRRHIVSRVKHTHPFNRPSRPDERLSALSLSRGNGLAFAYLVGAFAVDGHDEAHAARLFLQLRVVQTVLRRARPRVPLRLLGHCALRTQHTGLVTKRRRPNNSYIVTLYVCTRAPHTWCVRTTCDNNSERDNPTTYLLITTNTCYGPKPIDRSTGGDCRGVTTNW